MAKSNIEWSCLKVKNTIGLVFGLHFLFPSFCSDRSFSRPPRLWSNSRIVPRQKPSIFLSRKGWPKIWWVMDFDHFKESRGRKTKLFGNHWPQWLFGNDTTKLQVCVMVWGWNMVKQKTIPLRLGRWVHVVECQLPVSLADPSLVILPVFFQITFRWVCCPKKAFIGS